MHARAHDRLLRARAPRPSRRTYPQVRQGKGLDAREFSVTVSVGIVSEMLETILYARVRMPARCQVRSARCRARATRRPPARAETCAP